MKTLHLILILAALATSAHAQIPAAMPGKLVTLRESYEQAVERATASIRGVYQQELQQLKLEYTKAGNLEAALAVDTEVKQRFPSGPAAAPVPGPITTTPASAPDRLVTLRGNFERAIDRATASIHVTYQQELQRLKLEFTKASNLEAAVAVDKELKELFPNLPQTLRVPATMTGLPKLAATQFKDMAILPLQVGSKLFGDRDYKWTSVPNDFAGLKYAQPRNCHQGVTTFRVDTDGLVYLAVINRWLVRDGDKGEDNKISRRQLERSGWKHLGEKRNLKESQEFDWLVFARACKGGESFTIQTDKYCPPILLTN